MGKSKQGSVDMNINLWYNKDMNQWRWTLVQELDDLSMESGTSPDLGDALADVQRTIEWMLETPEE